MGIVKVKNLRIYAYHGCMKEEFIIGSDYLVNIVAWGNMSIAEKSDNLNDAVDYVTLTKIAKEEMHKPSKLLEAVVARIIDRCLMEHSLLLKIQVTVEKLNPPLNADAESVSVTMKKRREL